MSITAWASAPDGHLGATRPMPPKAVPMSMPASARKTVPAPTVSREHDHVGNRRGRQLERHQRHARGGQMAVLKTMYGAARNTHEARPRPACLRNSFGEVAVRLKRRRRAARFPCWCHFTRFTQPARAARPPRTAAFEESKATRRSPGHHPQEQQQSEERINRDRYGCRRPEPSDLARTREHHSARWVHRGTRQERSVTCT